MCDIAEMDVESHVLALEVAGSRLAGAARLAGLDAPIPSCPSWSVRDLLAHTGGVHRWATFHVASSSDKPTSPDEEEALFAHPDDDGLLEWFEAGHRTLVETLRAAPSDTDCWTFLTAPSPLAFWARRQAHETTMHRIDVELALGPAGPVATELAADGVDELLTGFMARRKGRLLANPERTLAVEATDTGEAWTLRIGPEGRAVERASAAADCTVAAPAAELYLLLWNRMGTKDASILGDAGVLELWRELARITWA